MCWALLPNLIFTVVSWGRYSYSPSCSDADTEAHRNEITYVTSPNCSVFSVNSLWPLCRESANHRGCRRQQGAMVGSGCNNWGEREDNAWLGWWWWWWWRRWWQQMRSCIYLSVNQGDCCWIRCGVGSKERSQEWAQDLGAELLGKLNIY